MLRRVGYIALLIVAIVVVSCNEQPRTIDMHDMESCAWVDAEEFIYDNSDSLAERDISIAVRYGKGYVADSVSLHILTISPDSLVVEEPFTLHIPRIRAVRPEEQTFLYRSRVVLNRKGEYRFRLTPDTLVEGISSVGIIVEDR